MNAVIRIAKDFLRVFSVLGGGYALKWLGMIMLNFPDVLERGDLQPVDAGMGTGPFKVKYNDYVKFIIAGSGAFSGIREMYARDVYLHGGVLTIADGDTVLDLGANMGNFTNLALAHGPAVKVVAVEPSKQLSAVWQKSVGLNEGFISRAQFIRAFVGEMGVKQADILNDKDYANAKWISEYELLALTNLQHIDFLKCDIEGGEFGLLKPGSRILDMTNKIAIEVHQFAGDVEEFLAMLSSEGFTLKHVKHDPDGSVTVLGQR